MPKQTREPSELAQLRAEVLAAAKRERYDEDLDEVLASDAACRVLWHIMEACLWTKNFGGAPEDVQAQSGARSVAVMLRKDVLRVADLNRLHRMELLYEQPAPISDEAQAWAVQRAKELGLSGDEPSRG